MLQRRRTIASIPDGLMKTDEMIRKGRAVCRKLNTEKTEYVLALPKAAADLNDLYGFITLRIDEDVYKESKYDNIEAGVRAVCYTLVPNEEWATTEFDGELVMGDKCTVSVASGKEGMIVKCSESDTVLFEVIAVTPAMGGYEEAMVTVKVL